MHTNQELLTHFFLGIIKLMSHGSSDKYAEMVLKKFIQDESTKFPFLNLIDSNSITTEVKIDPQINTVQPQLIGQFIIDLNKTLFSDLFRHLLASTLTPELVTELKELGVNI